MRILIVDDHEDSARLLSMLLDTMGHDTRCALTGEQAVTMSSDFKPEAIVLDLSLPDADGFEVATRLRALPGLADVKIVAVTGWSDPEAAQQAKAMGFRAFLIKPVDPMKLEQALR